MEVQNKLNGIFQEVFNDGSLQIKPETTANDVDGWDSFSHVILISAIEMGFNIRFDLKDVMAFKNVGDMMKCIDRKTAP